MFFLVGERPGWTGHNLRFPIYIAINAVLIWLHPEPILEIKATSILLYIGRYGPLAPNMGSNQMQTAQDSQLSGFNWRVSWMPSGDLVGFSRDSMGFCRDSIGFYRGLLGYNGDII